MEVEQTLEDEFISLDEASKICNVTRPALYKWAKAGKITIYKKGRHSLVKKEEIHRIKKENEEIRPLYEK
jgi:excisionase family DNA binding protein